MKNILEIKNVSKYFGKHKVVDNVSLDVKEGEVYGFLGPNGAGKTTTIKMILGLLNIDEGEIRINGHDVKNDFEKAMEDVGGIVENPDMYGYMSGVDNLKLYARLRNVKKERINEIIELVDMKDAAKMKVSKYSLGMKQRMGLALTLLHSPKLLILDEPTNGLDPAGIKHLRDILKEISRKDKVAVFVSSHILTEMELMCDKVAVIDKGKIVKVEEIGENKQEENIEEETQITVKQLEKAEEILKQNKYEVKIVDSKLDIKIEYAKVSEVVKLLVKNDIDIFGVVQKEKTLEDIFFDATQKKEEKGGRK